MMGVDNREPYTPPLLIVKVPPDISSMLRVPSFAFLPSATISYITEPTVGTTDVWAGTAAVIYSQR